VNVFDLHRGVVHQNAHGQGEPSERHEVDGLTQGAEHGKGGQDRKGDGKGDDEGTPPRAKKEQNHYGCEQRCNQAFL
jgi:hypothetical protein